jgi:hypothetical protein
MKKAISLALSLALMASMSVTAFASDAGSSADLANSSDTSDWSSKDISIDATYSTKADEVVNTYKVTIAWTAPSFSYEFDGKTYTWNTTDLKYEESTNTGAGWSNSGEGTLELSVTNYSDKAVSCATELKDTDNDGVTVSFSEDEGNGTEAEAAINLENVADAKDKTTKNSGKEKICKLGGTIKVDGTPTLTEESSSLAKITVTVAAKQSK